MTRSLTRWRFSARGLGTTIFITAMCAITVWLTVVGTEVLAVRNRQFAPIPRMTVQAGALPFRIREGEVEVLVIRTRRDSHWTIAKSTRDGKTAMLETASAAAYQDAGVNGRAQPTLIGEYFYRRENRSYVVIVYPVLVNEQLSDWPESTRQRRWCSVETAADLVASDALGALIRDFQPS